MNAPFPHQAIDEVRRLLAERPAIQARLTDFSEQTRQWSAARDTLLDTDIFGDPSRLREFSELDTRLQAAPHHERRLRQNILDHEEATGDAASKAGQQLHAFLIGEEEKAFERFAESYAPFFEGGRQSRVFRDTEPGLHSAPARRVFGETDIGLKFAQFRRSIPSPETPPLTRAGRVLKAAEEIERCQFIGSKPDACKAEAKE